MTPRHHVRAVSLGAYLFAIVCMAALVVFTAAVGERRFMLVFVAATFALCALARHHYPLAPDALLQAMKPWEIGILWRMWQGGFERRVRRLLRLDLSYRRITEDEPCCWGCGQELIEREVFPDGPGERVTRVVIRRSGEPWQLVTFCERCRTVHLGAFYEPLKSVRGFEQRNLDEACAFMERKDDGER